MNEKAILNFDLFQGDDTPTTVFSNRMLVTRRQHPCVVCWQGIPAGTRVRAQTERDDDDRIVKTFYVCPTCCEAMAIAGTEADIHHEQIEARYSMGIEAGRAVGTGPEPVGASQRAGQE